MKTIITGAAVMALTLTGLTARAACTDPRVAARQGISPDVVPLILPRAVSPSSTGRQASENIVGTWHVTYTSEGAPFAQAFIQWHSDGTEWENINNPILGGTICMGSWKEIDRSHVVRNHYGWLFTDGTVSGYFNETETDEVAQDGESYSGFNSTKIYDLNGKFQVEVTGTATAKRIGP
jgi:hypothetical protein